MNHQLMVSGGLFSMLLVAALISFVFGFSLLLYKLFSRTSGLDKLRKVYQTAAAPQGENFKKQSVAIGAVHYKNIVDIWLSQEGLYLHVKPFLSRYEAVLIPWTDIGTPQRATITWQRAVRLKVGDPPLATFIVKEPLYEKMLPYLQKA
ncbi:MAG TPA: hypothetical protein PKN04_00025 [bacterium]|nr:hypothetical protein [bacterium]HNT64142.1 hypothetical protein [bacterium]